MIGQEKVCVLVMVKLLESSSNRLNLSPIRALELKNLNSDFDERLEIVKTQYVNCLGK